METKTDLTIPTTYEDFCNDLKNKRFLGEKMSADLQQTENPLIFAIDVLLSTKTELVNPSNSIETLEDLKRITAQLNTIIKDAIHTTNSSLAYIIELYCGLKFALAESKHSIEQIEAFKRQEKIYEAIIKDAFISCSPEKLSAINFNKGRQTSLLNQLVEFGAEELFYHAFEKLKGELSSSELNLTFETILRSYAGDETAEALNLASSLLERGDHCFVRMSNFLLESTMKQNKLVEMLSVTSNDKNINLDDYLIHIQKQVEENKNKYTEEEYISKYCHQKRKNNSSQDLLTSKAKEEYKKYILDTNGQILTYRSLSNSVEVQIIIDNLMAIKNDDALNANQKKSRAQDFIKTRRTYLDHQGRDLLQSLVEYKITNKELDFLQYNDVRQNEQNTVVVDSPKPQLSKQQQLLTQFFRKYDEKLAEDKTAWCGLYGFFATSNVNKSMSLLALTQHAQGSGKRSLEVMKELHWVDGDNQLTNEIGMFVS